MFQIQSWFIYGVRALLKLSNYAQITAKHGKVCSEGTTYFIHEKFVNNPHPSNVLQILKTASTFLILINIYVKKKKDKAQNKFYKIDLWQLVKREESHWIFKQI